MKERVIAFVGGGHMASSLVGGLVNKGHHPDTLWVAEPDAEQRERLHSRFGVHTSADNADVVSRAEVVVLAVKPQVLPTVAQALASVVQTHQPLIISVAAGVRAPDIHRWLGGGTLSIVRTMPNTPALVSCGATALWANPIVSTMHRQLAESLLRAVGVAVWVPEEAHLDAVTALSGSGPAYFFLLMEHLEKAAVQSGIDPTTARLLTLQTAMGAAKMALETEESPATLRARVTSPGGTTERAIVAFGDGGLETLVQTAFTAARRRAKELGDILGTQE